VTAGDLEEDGRRGSPSEANRGGVFALQKKRGRWAQSVIRHQGNKNNPSENWAKEYNG